MGSQPTPDNSSEAATDRRDLGGSYSSGTAIITSSFSAMKVSTVFRCLAFPVRFRVGSLVVISKLHT